jgi:hypothetical protein
VTTLTVLILAVIALFIFEPPDSQQGGFGKWSLLVAGSFIVAAIYMGVRFREYLRRNRLSPTQLAGLVALLAGGLSLANAADESTRLSKVVVYTDDEVCIEAPLVAQTRDGVYLGDGKHHALVLIAMDRVRGVVIDRQRVEVRHSTVATVPCRERPIF